MSDERRKAADLFVLGIIRESGSPLFEAPPKICDAMRLSYLAGDEAGARRERERAATMVEARILALWQDIPLCELRAIVAEIRGGK